MAPIIYYMCSKCRMTYSSYEKAERCEMNHLSAISVKELEYRYGAYPSRVTLKFSDGKEWDYIWDDSFFMEMR